MRYIDEQLHTPGMLLACDDILLDRCEVDPAFEALRLWTPETYFVVAGYTNRILDEVRVDACVARGIPLYRRTSGGGTVVQGPGCLNYAVVLRMDRDPSLENISSTGVYVLERIAAAVERVTGTVVEHQGHTDLVVGGRKFSGNAQRRKTQAVLFHGTILLGFDLDVIEELLPMPTHQPEYREGRSHGAFLMNLGLDAAALTAALREEWEATTPYGQLPMEDIRSLAETRYLDHDWTYKF
jgi:lipoate---protein ligase